MSLVYAKKSDEIGSARRVFLHECAACGIVNLDVEEHQPLSGYALYESLLTYVAQSGSRRRSSSRYLPRACVQDSSLRFVRYSM